MGEAKRRGAEPPLPGPIQEYLLLPPNRGHLEPDMLKEWCTVAEPQARNAKAHLALGWMWYELGTPPLQEHQELSANPDSDEAVARLTSIFDHYNRAKNSFNLCFNTPGTNRMLASRSQAGLALVDYELADYASEYNPAVYQTGSKHKKDLQTGMLASAKTALSFKHERRPEDISFMHALTTILLLNTDTGSPYGDPFKLPKGIRALIDEALAHPEKQIEIPVVNQLARFIALPAPLRCSDFAANPDAAWHVSLWDHVNMNRQRLRIGNTGARIYHTLPPSLLGQDDYPSEHGFGTLKALLDNYSNGGGDGAIRLSSRPETVFLGERLEAVVNFLGAAISGMSDEGVSNPRDWFWNLPPQFSPISANLEKSREVESRMELIHMAGGLDITTMHDYGCIKSELANDYARWHQRDQALPAFDSAVSLFDKVATAKWKNREGYTYSFLRLKARIAKEAATIQKAIFTEDDAALEAAVDTYGQNLAAISLDLLNNDTAIINELSVQGHSEQEASDMVQRLMYSLTICLASATDESRATIAWPSSPRQQKVGHDQEWDVTILPYTIDTGFDLNRFSKLRIVPAAPKKQNNKSTNIYLVSPAELGHAQGEIYDTLSLLLDKMNNQPLNDTEEVLLQNIADTLSTSTEYAGLL